MVRGGILEKKKLIDELYNILVQYEKVFTREITLDAYLAYLDGLYVWYLGDGNAKIYNTIKGLSVLGVEASHDTVKRAVFKMIAILEKDVVNYGS